MKCGRRSSRLIFPSSHVLILNVIQMKKKTENYYTRIVIYAISEWEVKQTYIEGLPSTLVCLILFMHVAITR